MASPDQRTNLTQTGGRYPKKARVKPRGFTLNALTRARDENEPSMRSELSSPVKDKWMQALNTEVNTVQRMDCCGKLEYLKKGQVLRSKSVLECKMNEHEETMKYEAWLVVCGNKEAGDDERNFPPCLVYRNAPNCINSSTVYMRQ